MRHYICFPKFIGPKLLWGGTLLLALAFSASGVTEAPRGWTLSTEFSSISVPLTSAGPREFIYGLEDKGIFEGGRVYRGDVLVAPGRVRQTPPPFRPGLYLKGVPLRNESQRRKTGTSASRPFSLRSLLPTMTSSKGFTLIELVMVLLLLAVLAAVAIPNFQDFRSDARNSATKGSLGGLRSAIAIARAAIALREDIGPPAYPTVVELQLNTYNGSHPILNALSAQNKRIFDASAGTPVNPWSLQTIPFSQQSSIFDCAVAKSFVRSVALQTDFGWCYNQTTGEFWANSDKNGSVSPNTENRF